MAETIPSYALIGSGKVEAGSALALLDDYLPDSELGAFYRPATVERGPLRDVLNLIETDPDDGGLLGPDSTLPTEDVISDLLDRRDDGHDVTLIVLWPEEEDEDLREIVELAFENEIPVKNLSALLDDLDLEETAVEEEVEEPKRGRGRPKKEKTEEPEAKPEPSPVEVEQTAVESGDVWNDADAAADAKSTVVSEVKVQEVASQYFNEALMGALAGYVTNVVYKIAQENGWPLAGATVAKAVAETPVPTPAAPTAPKRGAATPSASKTRGVTDEPPFEGPYKDAKDLGPKKAYFQNEDGELRIARGRPRKGEKRIELAPSEVEEYREKGLLK